MENWKLERLKYCRIRKVDGVLKYYVMDGQTPVEVTKDVYLVIEHSYHKEWLMQHGKHNDWVSTEQIAEDEEMLDRHGHMPLALQVSSSEDVFFAPKEMEHRQKMIDRMHAEVNKLQDEQRSLVLSHIEENGIIAALSERDQVSARAIYLRRDTICRSIARKITEDEADE